MHLDTPTEALNTRGSEATQACVQHITLADNVTLLAFAAERHAAAPCCGAAAAGRPAAAAVDRYLLRARRSAANPPQRRTAGE